MTLIRTAPAELKKFNILYQDLLEKYEACENCYDDEEFIRQNPVTLLSLLESHESWKADLTKQDDVILYAYEGGSMAGGVVNQNRVGQVKARIEFYELDYCG